MIYSFFLNFACKKCKREIIFSFESVLFEEVPTENYISINKIISDYLSNSDFICEYCNTANVNLELADILSYYRILEANFGDYFEQFPTTRPDYWEYLSNYFKKNIVEGSEAYKDLVVNVLKNLMFFDD
jgi:hypothetical protein